MTPSDVARRIRPYMANRAIGDIKLWLDEKRILLRNGYWRIPIRPSREPQPLFPYFEALAELEEEIQEKEGFKVTLASGEPLAE